jgi:ADP-heptose:LPS heptosyltransferase
MYILALRSYGDYVILLNSIKHTGIKKNIIIIVSKHLQPLHEALNPSFSNNFKFSFLDFRIKKGLFSFFTNRHFFSLNTILELFSISKMVRKLEIKNELIYLEHKARKAFPSFFIGNQLQHIYTNGNVYDAFARFFEINSAELTFSLPVVNTIYKVLIFPDSRKKHKIIDNNTLKQLTFELIEQKFDFKIASFDHIKSTDIDSNNQVVYNNFKDLIFLIKECDFVITSDSVPAHIAEYLEKPHIILYNDRVNNDWLTPFAKKYKMYTTFGEASIFFNQYFNSKC